MRTFNGHRTRLLPQSRAEQFARCVAANPAFAHVEVKSNPNAKTANRYYVRYQPANPGRAEELRAAEEESRAARAVSEAANYTFWADPDHSGLFWCLNLTSREVYETTFGSCTCGDHTFRGSKAGVPCKHMQLLRTQLAEEAAGKEALHLSSRAVPVTPAPAVRDYAAIRTRVAEDFPEF